MVKRVCGYEGENVVTKHAYSGTTGGAAVGRTDLDVFDCYVM